MTDPKTLASLAHRLDASRLARKPVERLTLEVPDLSPDEGYAIQGLGFGARGEKLAGFKMGLTSKAKREQMNLHDSIFGFLTEPMRLIEGQPYSLSSRIHPKAEPEIALRLARPITRPLVSIEDAAAHVDAWAPAIEVLDSRFANFKYFSLPDVIADNASSSDYLIAAPRPWSAELAKTLPTLEMRFYTNGVLTESAHAEAISGHPLQSLVELSALAERHLTWGKLEAGQWVLTGAATAAVKLESGMRVHLEVGTEAPLGFMVG